MNAVDMNQVIEKLAEKLGVAAEALRPVAEEVVRQYQVRCVVYAIGLFLLAAALALVARSVVRMAVQAADAEDDKIFARALGLFLSAIPVVFLIGHAVLQVGQAIAPLVSILGL